MVAVCRRQRRVSTRSGYQSEWRPCEARTCVCGGGSFVQNFRVVDCSGEGASCKRGVMMSAPILSFLDFPSLDKHDTTHARSQMPPFSEHNPDHLHPVKHHAAVLGTPLRLCSRSSCAPPCSKTNRVSTKAPSQSDSVPQQLGQLARIGCPEHGCAMCSHSAGAHVNRAGGVQAVLHPACLRTRALIGYNSPPPSNSLILQLIYAPCSA
jgi:hypothetical protein